MDKLKEFSSVKTELKNLPPAHKLLKLACGISALAIIILGFILSLMSILTFGISSAIIGFYLM